MLSTLPSPSEMDPIIELQNVDFSIDTPEGKIDILKDIHLTVNSGESCVIYGRSGSGKSTLLSIVAGLQSATRGSVQVLNQRFDQMNEHDRTLVRRGQIGFVYQDFQLLPNLTAFENVVLPLKLLGLGVDKTSLHGWFERFGLTDRIKHYPSQLSGGEQQRVAIIRAMASQPKLLLADEPTGNLDRQTARGFIDILLELIDKEGISVLLVSHDNDLIEVCQNRLELQ